MATEIPRGWRGVQKEVISEGVGGYYRGLFPGGLSDHEIGELLINNSSVEKEEYCNADRTTWKLTLQDINATPKELKTERDCSHRQLFHPFWACQYGATTRESSDEKYPHILISSPDPKLSTPTESRHTTCLLGGKSASVKLMSHRENRGLDKTYLKNMDRTMQELQHIRSIKDLRPKNS